MNIKTTFIYLIITLYIGNHAIAQKISLNEIQTFCSNKNWETTNKTLLAQKWDYYDSKKGDDEHYDIITWAFERNYYDDSRASGWVYLYNYDGLPNKIMYRFRVKDYYTAIQSQLKNFAYTLTDESIFDERVTTTYENKGFVLKIAYNREQDNKNNDNDYSYSNSGNYSKTYTVYEVSMYKKGGVYDPNNGKKKDYDEDGNLELDYTLKDGKLEGKAKAFDAQGRITGQYNFKNGEKEGENYNYYYFEDSDNYIKTLRNFKDGVLNGKLVETFVTAAEEHTTKILNYKEGLLNGRGYFSENKTIVVKNYKDGNLNGDYKEYLDLKSAILGGLAKLDTLMLPNSILVDQNYIDGELNGPAKTFDFTGSLISEGNYKDSLQTGTWKFYHGFESDADGEKLEYAGKLYLIANYREGKLNGKHEQFSILQKIEIPCENEEDNEDGCFDNEVLYFYALSNYKDNELHGESFINKEDGSLYQKGYYVNGLKSGEWIEYNKSEFSPLYDEVRSFEKGAFVKGKKEGNFARFNENNVILESYAYQNGIITGKHITFVNGLPVASMHFSSDGILQRLEILNNPEIRTDIKIIEENSNFYKVVEKKFSNSFSETYNFKINKIDANYKITPRYFWYNYDTLKPSEKIKDGQYEFLNAEGKSISAGNYSYNTKVGDWNNHYYDQDIKNLLIYNSGILTDDYYYTISKNELYSGEFIFKDTENNITEERKIKNGKRHGTTRYKDQNNKTIRKESYKEGVLKE